MSSRGRSSRLVHSEMSQSSIREGGPGITRRKKLLFAGIVTVCFLAALEGLLILVGAGKTEATSDPFVGFSNQHPLFVIDDAVPGGTHMRTAENKLVWFNDQRFARTKKTNVRRVFCVGGSTTFGRPYSDTTSFCGWLRELLPLADSSTEWEVINAGGVSYASYRVAAVMEELSQYEPDLFIVYSGQNEFLERRTYAGMFGQTEVRRNLTALLSKTRTFSVLKGLINTNPQGSQRLGSADTLPGEVDEMLNHTIGPIDYHRDAQWQANVVRHYRTNLQRMTTIAQGAGAEILFIVPASNEKDCSPFKSEFDSSLDESQRDHVAQLLQAAVQVDDVTSALKQLRAAKNIDKDYADLDFLIGKRLFNSQSLVDARVAFQAALDNDVCPLRATSAIRSAVRAWGAASGVMMVDFDQRLRRLSRSEFSHSILGEEYFLDHVHPTIEVHQQLALWIVEVLQSRDLVAGTAISPSQLALLDKQVRGRIDTAAHGVSRRNLAKVLHWSGKFDEAIPHARAALEMLPYDPESLLVLADCLHQTNKIDEAITTCEQLLDVAPMHPPAILLYGELLFNLKTFDQAAEMLSFAQAMFPIASDSQIRALFFLGRIELARGNFREADRLLSDVDQLYPNNSDTMSYLAQSKAGVGETSAAIDIYLRLIEQSPRRLEARQRLGLLLMKEGRIAEAHECFARIINIDADNAQAKNHLEIARQLLEKQ